MIGRNTSRNEAKLAAMAVVAALALLGCRLLRHTSAAAQPAAAPRVVAAAATAEPVSAPQTTERLPPPQPIPPGAIPAVQEPEEETPATEPAPPQAPRQKAPVRRAPTPVATAPAPAPEPATSPPAATAPAPQLRPMLTPGEEQDLQQRIERSLLAAERFLAQAGAADKDEVARVRSFIEQARQARSQGDLNRARSLSDRAELLASGLARAPK